jgi:hypothetical protein
VGSTLLRGLLCLVPVLCVSATTALAGAVPTAPPAPPGGPLWGISAALYGKTTLPGGHFTFALPAGSEVHDAVVLHNYQAQPLPLALYATDLIVAQGGGLAPIQADQPSHGVGRWTSLAHADIVVPAHGQVQVPFTVAPPRGTVPGDYYGAVVAAAAGAGGQGVRIVTRAALIVHLQVPGVARVGLALGSLEQASAGAGVNFTLAVRNTGNVTLSLDGAVLLRNGGHLAARLALKPDGLNVIPGGTAMLQAAWLSPPFLGRVAAQAVLAAHIESLGTRTYSSNSLTLTFLPWQLAGSLGAVLCLAVLGGYVGRHRLRRAWGDWRADRALLAQARARRRAAREGQEQPSSDRRA